MTVGDLVRETTKMDRKCSMGLVLEVSAAAANGDVQYFVHFFDDDDKCWMSPNFVETINASR